MQFSFNTLVALAAIPAIRLALAQEEAGPSPTNSFGCEPHGDHWHCEGAVTQTSAPVVSTSSTSAAPVLVVTTTTSASSSTTSAPAEDHDHDDHEHEDEEHTDAAGSGTLAPSPTASVGCEPHGDHWHCEGPKTLTSVAPVRTISNNTATTAPVSTGSSTGLPISSLVPTGGASLMGAGVVGGLMGLVGAFAL